MRIPVRVLVPVGFTLSEAHNYATIYFLHGRGGAMGTSARSQAEDIGYLGKLAQSRHWIMVAPQDEEGNGFWMEGQESQKKWNEFLAKELIAEIEKLFKIDTRACQRLIVGISMGGTGAFTQAFRYRDLYAGFASHSGTYRMGVKDVMTNPLDQTCFGLQEKQLDESLITRKYSAGKRYLKPMWLDYGENDEPVTRTYKSGLAFIDSLENLEPLAVIHRYTGVDQTHSLFYWRSHLSEYVKWYESVLSKSCETTTP